MKATQHNFLLMVLATTLAIPVAAMAADAADAGHDSHHPAATDAAVPQTATPATPPQAAISAGMQSLRERMQSLRRTRDPAARMQMMEEQMNQMGVVMKDMETACPMTGPQPGGMEMMGMMGGKGGMGMMGQGAPGGSMGMSGSDGMMARRLQMLENRIDQMQMMLQTNMGKPQGSPQQPAR